MELKKIARLARHRDELVGIAPVYKVSLSGDATLIGTGFWVTERGHLITAKHVIEENIGIDGIDTGPIYAVYTSPERTFSVRTLRQTHMHKDYDVALSSTVGPDDNAQYILTKPLPMTLEELAIGDGVYTHAYASSSQQFPESKEDGFTTSELEAEFAIPDLNILYGLGYRTRRETGAVTAVFKEKRDAVMMPFPCIESEMYVYGANSGGPIFDSKGRICGINCSSYEGTNISYQIPIKSVLNLFTNELELMPEDAIPKRRSILELALSKRVLFEPSVAKFAFRRGEFVLTIPRYSYI